MTATAWYFSLIASLLTFGVWVGTGNNNKDSAVIYFAIAGFHLALAVISALESQKTISK